MNTLDRFQLDGKIAVITGGAGLLGPEHARAILDGGGRVVLLDIDQGRLQEVAKELVDTYGPRIWWYQTDLTDERAITDICARIHHEPGDADILINNVANNPHVQSSSTRNFSRLEYFPLEAWNQDFAVGVTSAFLMSRILGAAMAAKGGGVILNIASDLGVIAPDQRIYRKTGLPEEQQPVKPVTYSVVKHALIGLTKYLATYWADKSVRVNSISPAGVYNGQPDEFVQKLSNLIPMGRMAQKDEYRAAILFLCSDASSYMTGTNLIIDGGRTCW